MIKPAQLAAKFKRFAEENDVIVRYETLKSDIRKRAADGKRKYNIFRPFSSEKPLSEHLKELSDSFEKRKKKTKK